MSATTEKYQGWTNYETWQVNLWWSNDQGSYTYWAQQAQEVWEEAEADKTFTRSEIARAKLAERMKDGLEESKPEGLEGLWECMVDHFISEVNFHEIAGSWLDDCDVYEAHEGEE
jgi:hypothetical protein